MTEDEPRWTPGSRFRVRSLGPGDDPMESSGTFEGFLPLSDRHVMALTLDDSHDDEGMRRLIPVGKILSVDVLEQAPETESEDDPLYYS